MLSRIIPFLPLFWGERRRGDDDAMCDPGGHSGRDGPLWWQRGKEDMLARECYDDAVIRSCAHVAHESQLNWRQLLPSHACTHAGSHLSDSPPRPPSAHKTPPPQRCATMCHPTPQKHKRTLATRRRRCRKPPRPKRRRQQREDYYTTTPRRWRMTRNARRPPRLPLGERQPASQPAPEHHIRWNHPAYYCKIHHHYRGVTEVVVVVDVAVAVHALKLCRGWCIWDCVCVCVRVLMCNCHAYDSLSLPLLGASV